MPCGVSNTTGALEAGAVLEKVNEKEGTDDEHKTDKNTFA